MSGGASPRATRLGVAAAMLAASVLLSRVIGYVRVLVLANLLGAGPEAGAYVAAFAIPDLLNHLLAGGAFSIAFVPLYTRVRERQGEQAAVALFGTILGTLGLIAVAVTALLWWYADALVALQFPYFDTQTQALVTRLTRIVLPAQIFFVSGGILRAVLMAEGRFGSQALAPLLYNAGIIAGGLATGEPEGFAWGVLVGAFVGNWLVPFLDLRRTHAIRPRFAPWEQRFLSFLWIALPLMLGLSLATADEWYDRWFGGLHGPEVVAWLSYARMLFLAPGAIIGQAVATAVLPTLARLHASGQSDEHDRTLQVTLQASVSLALLSAVAMFVFAGPLVELLFHHGRFDAEAARRTAAILAVFSFGIPGWVAQQVGVRAFYAREDTWRPMFLGTAVVAAAIPLYLMLGERWQGEGLALAGVIAMTINSLLTLTWARRRHGAPAGRLLLPSLARAAVIAALAGLAAWLATGRLDAAGRAAAIADLALGGAAFGVAALAGVVWLGDETMRAALAGIRRRLSRQGRGAE